MSTPDADSKSWSPRWVKLLLVAVTLALLGLGTLHLLGRASTARWQRYAARLRSGGDPLTFEEIEARRSKIPEELNGALVIERLSEALNNMGEARWDVDSAVLVFGGGRDGVDFFKGIPRYRIEPSRSYLEEHRDLLDKLSVLRDMSAGRFELPLDADHMPTALPNLSPLRSAAKLQYLDSVLALVDGDVERAAAKVRVLSHISGTLNEQPLLIPQLVQISIDAFTKRGIENILRVGRVEHRVLDALSEIVEARLAGGTMKWALLGERAYFVATCDAMADGKLPMAALAGGAPSGGVWYLPVMLIRENQMRGVELLTGLVEAADDPTALMKAGQRIDKEIPAMPPTRVIIRIIMPSLLRSVVLQLSITAQLQCTRLGLAAERFRLKEGRLPESLDELVPDYIDSVPTDPFDGQPMRLAVTEKGIVIYSIGEDLVDDGGLVARQETKPHLRDFGFRLFKPEQRGLLLTDEPPPGDD